MGSIYSPQKVVVEKIIEETPTIKTFVLRPEKEFSFKTGQFIELTYPGEGEAPFTPSSDPNVKDRIEVTIMKTGRITQALHGLREGAYLGIRGPYGNGYPVESFCKKEILIVGGGVGLAPLRSLIYALFSLKNYKRLIICYGARTPQDIVYKEEIKNWKKNAEVHLTVDRKDASWQGKVGVVTTLLDDLSLDKKNTICVVCGPPIMMKFTTLKLLNLGIKASHIYLSMEKNMSCGLGKCGHCRLGRFYVCKDGPVFKFEDIKDIEDIWE